MTEPLLPSLRARAPRRRRVVVWTVGGMLLTCLISFVGYHWVRGRVADSDLQEALAETDRLDPAWRMEALEARRRAVPAEQNGALAVFAAGSFLSPTWADESVLEDVEKLRPTAQLHERHVAALRFKLAALKPALGEGRKLVDLPTGRYRIIWSDDFFGTLLPHLERIRHVGRLLGYDAALRTHDGDGAGACRSCRALLNAARSVGDEPLVISQLVRIAVRGQAVTTAERILAQGQAPEKALAEVQQALADEAKGSVLLIGLRGERAGFHYQLTNLEAGKFPLDRLTGVSKDGRGAPKERGLWDGVSDLWVVPRLKEGHAWLLRYLNDAIAIANGPVDDQEPKMQALEARLEDAPPVGRLLPPALFKVAGGERTSQAGLRCAVAGLAAERYRQNQGRWPDSLNDLVGAGLLPAVPVDPYSGKPLCLRRAPDGLVVYSLGCTGIYDGTALDEPGFDEGQPRVEFRLWDVARRRGPPREPPWERLEEPVPDDDPAQP